MEKLLTFGEALKVLRIHPNTLYGYLQSGKLPAIRLGGGGTWRIKESDLENFLKTEPEEG